MTDAVVVTGASGFIGRPLVAELLRRGRQVHAIGRMPPRSPAEVRWHEADLLVDDPSPILRSVGPASLVHLAWMPTAPGAFWSAVENLDWVAATLRLLRTHAEICGGRVIVAGSCAEYDLTGDGLLHEENSPLRPTTLYGASKLATSQILTAAAPVLGLSLAWARIFYLYGPREHSDRLVGSVITSLLAGREAPCTGGTQVRDYLHVDDVADALVAVLDSELEGPVNIGSGSPTSVATVIECIGRTVGQPELLRLGARARPAGDPDVVVADTSRLQALVGWRPRWSLEDGIADTVSWFRSEQREV